MRFHGTIGGSTAQQLWPDSTARHQHGDPVRRHTIGGTMYLHVIVNGPSFGRVRRTEMWKSTDHGASWQYSCTLPAAKDGGFFQSLNGGELNTPTDNLVAAPKITLLNGGAWGAEDCAHVAQLYGGYTIPGSTLSDLHLSVSQWNTTPGAGNMPYHAMQFRCQGVLA